MYQIKIIRNQIGFTQKELAEKADVSQAYINELEKGKKKNPSILVIKRIAQALKVDASELLK